VNGAAGTRPIIIGVDGGATKTVALVAAPDGTLLGRGFAGSSNHQKIGIDAACAAIHAAIRAAFDAAGLPETPPAAACLGLAGIDRAEDAELYRPWAAQHFAGASVALINDAELALAAGTPEGWGVGVICGTGAICTGRNQAGETARADGWGWLLGDDGSGFAIGREALRAVMRAYDGRGPATLLTETVLAHWRLGGPEDLMQRVYIEEASTADVASLAAVVDRAAQAGDGVARAILQQAAEELVTTMETVARRLNFTGAVPCGLAGSVIVKSAFMAGFVQEVALRRGLALGPVELVAEPATGALRQAQRLLAHASVRA
jgi:N-acetylglucosamine kinase-like BadF-type ATPase